MFNFKNEDLIIKEYISLLNKKTMIDNILLVSFVEENGLYKIDPIMNELFKVLTIFVNYTEGVEIPDLYIKNENSEILNLEVAFELYDYLIENGIYDKLATDNNDILSFCELLETAINDKLKNLDSIESIIANGIDKLLKLLDKNTSPKEMKKIITQLGKMDLDKVPMLKQIYNFANGLSDK